TPGTTSTIPFSGATSRLDGLDFRPANGLLYGYDESSNRVVTVDPLTAFTTLVSNPTTGSTTSDLGIDFNPVPDRMRLVNVDDQNLRINVDTGATIVDGTLAYDAGDPNTGVNPLINEAAYSNNDNDPATATTLYYLDYGLDILVTTSNPNGGVVNTVGNLGVLTSSYTGLDIFTDGGVNTAYAILSNSDNLPSLYTVNLQTGAAALIGQVGNGSVFEVYSLALVPVPEPSSWFVVTTVALTGAALRRRRR
ncbi:MAG TPA: DUF4394 domain-containing protein, partial [Pirellulaceae bacterium]